METLLYIALGFALVSTCFTSALGLFVIFHIVRPQKSPADKTNRINKIRIFWFALTREDQLAKDIPWLKRDEYENIHPYK